MKKVVFCLASNEEACQRIVDRLLASGFTNEDISILFPDRNKQTTRLNDLRSNERGAVNMNEPAAAQKTPNKGCLGFEKHTKAPEGGLTGVATGGILGGSLGLLAGIGALAIPGLGPFIAAGPIMAALSGTALGGSLGLLIGALIGSGISEYEAKKYEAGLLSGNILLSVHADNEDEIHRATDIMRKEGGKDISTSREKACSC